MLNPQMRIGTGEIIVLLFVIVVIFSASRMGTLGNALGKFLYSFRKAVKGQDFIDVRRVADSARGAKGKPPPEDATLVDEKPK